jgi:hypothetical protein
MNSTPVMNEGPAQLTEIQSETEQPPARLFSLEDGGKAALSVTPLSLVTWKLFGTPIFLTSHSYLLLPQLRLGYEG